MGKDNEIRKATIEELKRLHGEVRWNNNHVFSLDTKNPDDVPVYING